jgi:uncharacterized protein (TIGR02271 family)
MIDASDIPTLPGSPIVDRNGVPVGVLKVPYQEPGTGNPLWASIHRNTTGAPAAFVPLDGASRASGDDGTITLGVDVAAIDTAPVVSERATFTDEHATALHAHYSAGEETPTAVPVAGGTWPVTVVRSEEQLRVRTETVPSDRVRLKKVVVTEEKTITVTVRREEFQLVREPYESETTDTEPTVPGGARLDMTLHEERVVITKEIVPVEHVHVDVVRVNGTIPVTATVRKERVDVTTDHERSPRSPPESEH